MHKDAKQFSLGTKYRPAVYSGAHVLVGAVINTYSSNESCVESTGETFQTMAIGL